jgi:hypothetical protein
MLLEWGHSIYFDNSGKKQSMSALKIPNILFRENLPDPNNAGEAAVQEALKKNPNLTNNQKDAIYYEVERKVRKQNEIKADYPKRLRAALQENKEETGGNYDAMMAKVSNFSWTLNSDLSYSITLDLVSVGDIIDSLKMNFGGTSLTEDVWNNLEIDKGVRNLKSIQLNSGASAFNSFLSELVEVLDDPKVQKEFEPALQTKFELANKSAKQQGLIEHIKNAYIDVIDAKLKKFEPLQDARALLKKNNLIKETSINLGAVASLNPSRIFGNDAYNYKYNGNIQELRNLLEKDSRLSPYLPSDDGYLSYTLLVILGLDVEVTTLPTVFNPGGFNFSPAAINTRLIVDSGNKDSFYSVGDTLLPIIYNADQKTSKKLNELKLFFTDKLKAKDTLIWINLIEYLDGKKGSAKDVIELLLKNGYFDKEENYPLDKYQE